MCCFAKCVTFLFLDIVRVVRLRRWAQMKNTHKQLFLRARVDEGDVDEVDQAEAEATDAGAEGVVWDKHPMTSVQMTLFESNV